MGLGSCERRRNAATNAIKIGTRAHPSPLFHSAMSLLKGSEERLEANIDRMNAVAMLSPTIANETGKAAEAVFALASAPIDPPITRAMFP